MGWKDSTGVRRSLTDPSHSTDTCTVQPALRSYPYSPPEHRLIATIFFLLSTPRTYYSMFNAALYDPLINS